MIIVAELEASKKQTEADKKVIDDLVRERDILNKVIHEYVPWCSSTRGFCTFVCLGEN